MRENGLTNIEISFDHWHEKYEKSSSINNCIEACLEYGIKVNLRTLATKSKLHGDVLKKLNKDLINRIHQITCGQVFSVGRAKYKLKNSDFYKQSGSGNCYTALNLAVSSTGAVYPCCAGLDQINEMKETPS